MCPSFFFSLLSRFDFMACRSLPEKKDLKKEKTRIWKYFLTFSRDCQGETSVLSCCDYWRVGINDCPLYFFFLTAPSVFEQGKDEIGDSNDNKETIVVITKLRHSLPSLPKLSRDRISSNNNCLKEIKSRRNTFIVIDVFCQRIKKKKNKKNNLPPVAQSWPNTVSWKKNKERYGGGIVFFNLRIKMRSVCFINGLMCLLCLKHYPWFFVTDKNWWNESENIFLVV